jgi:hypothetical protein
MKIENRMANLPIVTGRIDAATLGALARSGNVIRVELDGEMRALGE